MKKKRIQKIQTHWVNKNCDLKRRKIRYFIAVGETKTKINFLVLFNFLDWLEIIVSIKKKEKKKIIIWFTLYTGCNLYFYKKKFLYEKKYYDTNAWSVNKFIFYRLQYTNAPILQLFSFYAAIFPERKLI